MSNRASSFPATPSIAPLHRHGGKLTAMSELPIHPLGDDYLLEGNGVIRRLPTLPAGATVTFRIRDNPLFVNSPRLICFNGTDYPAMPGDLAFARSDGDGAWRLFVVPSNPRRRLTANLVLYADAANGNDANNGLAAGTGNALATIMAAYRIIHDQIDHNGFTSTIQCAAGTYNEQLQFFGHLVGTHLVFLRGDTTTPGNCIINVGASQKCVYVKDYGFIDIAGFLFQGGSGAFGINAEQYGGVDLSLSSFGSLATGRSMSANDMGVININANINLTGSSNFALIAQLGGRIQLNSTITIPSALAFNTFAYADGISRILANGGSITGAGVAGTTGTRYSVNQNSLINTNTASPTFFPGNVAGTSATGGIYT